jgi:hypothetical protein
MPHRLTIDVAAGDRWLIALNRKATADWLRTADARADRVDPAAEDIYRTACRDPGIEAFARYGGLSAGCAPAGG